MDDLDAALAVTSPATETATSTVTPRKCRRHVWVDMLFEDTALGGVYCIRCTKPKDETRSRRGSNNRKRGNAAELDAAKAVGGRKVGPMGWPWDVEMPGYARLQVKKMARPPSLREIAGWLADIARTPGEEMPGVIWIEPGRGGERLAVFRLKDFSERHGLPSERTLEEAA